MTVDAGHIEAFIAAARRVAACGLVRCSSGNLSWRVDDERMLVTASQAWMADLAPRQVAVCRVADAEPLSACRPSVESRFHAGVLRRREEMRAVLHCQSPAATAIACCEPAGADFNVIVEVPFYIGPVATVPYLPPGSEELADAIVGAMAEHDMALLAHHGQVTVGRTLSDAIQRAAFFELACDILLRAGDRVRSLPPEAVAALRQTAHRPEGG
ncbi:MAG: class II aldolase/adducin family protein [Planctomycetota bacterium]